MTTQAQGHTAPATGAGPTTLTVGKIRGLQQIANERGIFVITAMDQRGSMRRMLNAQNPAAVPARKLIDIKLQLSQTFSPRSSAILLDPQYGAPESIVHATLSGKCGLLVTLEHQDYDQSGDVRRSRVLDNWSVEKIKRMGASAVKVLIYYHPDQQETVAWQERFVAETREQCARWDIPFVLETVVYAIGGMKDDSAEFAALKPDLVIRSAARLSPYCDLYKAEFPANIAYEKDEAKLAEWCRQLDAASKVPWVVLSAGVDIALFRTMVRIACQNGASGFLAGRAIWKNAIPIADDAERLRWLEHEGVANLQELVDVANAHATPWPRRAGALLPPADSIADTWYASY
jgi:tagatose 1,6-diphosphate aldolase